MNPRDYIQAAKDLIATSKRQANLRRATSTLYYALFHTLARSCADLLIGGAGAQRSAKAWTQTYRALNHKFSKNQCNDGNIMPRFPQEIQDFANAFVSMQKKRHAADYDPDNKIFKSEVDSDIAIVEGAITDFEKAMVKDKRAFSAFVLFPIRRD